MLHPCQLLMCCGRALMELATRHCCIVVMVCSPDFICCCVGRYALIGVATRHSALWVQVCCMHACQLLLCCGCALMELATRRCCIVVMVCSPDVMCCCVAATR
jgi:hypothetical protein